MRDPPDRLIPQDQPHFSMDKNRFLQNTSNGPKYLLMTRTNGNESLANVSPFLIKKVIDGTCGSEVDICKKIRNGKILIKTRNNLQAAKLITLTSLSPEIVVNVSEHPHLNFSKGVIYSNDLRGMEENEILQELKSQNVTEIRKIMKRVNNELIETGLIIITIASIILPESLHIGYERVKLRPYVPSPMRCRNCLRYGHPTKACTNNKICPHCALEYHSEEDDNTCKNPVTCSNCTFYNIENNKHSAIDKICPIFLKEKEIQTIITLEKMERRKAVETYNQRHQCGPSSYSTVTKTTKFNTSKTDNNKIDNTDNIKIKNIKTDSPNISSRELVNYNNTEVLSSDTQVSQSIIKPKTVNVLPRNTSNKTLQAVKRKTQRNNKGKQKQPKATTNVDGNETSESMSMDNE